MTQTLFKLRARCKKCELDKSALFYHTKDDGRVIDRWKEVVLMPEWEQHEHSGIDNLILDIKTQLLHNRD